MMPFKPAATVAAAVSLLAAVAGAAAQSVSVPWVATAWVEGHNSSARLIAGNGAGPAVARGMVAGVQLRLAEGWKTYWRHPGDSGGIAPTFDWSGSANLASARVLFPAPERLKDAMGYSIGYKRAVVFPVEIKAQDPSRPVRLSLALEYGICREICIPAEARLEAAIDPGLAVMPPDLVAALERVPRADAGVRPGDPALKRASAVLTGPGAHLAFDIAAGAAGAGVDLFVEAPDGIYLPITKRAGEPAAGVVRFLVDLKDVEGAAKLAGRPLRLTMVGPAGGAEASWIVK